MMSEKRFKVRNKREVSINYPSTERVYDYNKEDFLYNSEIEYLLNSLVEENEQLKEKLNNLKNNPDMLYHYYTLASSRGD